MKHNKGSISIILVAIIVLALGAVWYGITNRSEWIAKHAVAPTHTDTPVVPAAPAWKTYSNAENSFQIKYPSVYVASTTGFEEENTLAAFTYFDPAKGPNVYTPDQIFIRRLPAAAYRDYKNAMMKDVVFDGSGLSPQSFDRFQERQIGDKTFYYIQTGRFEGTFAQRYYYVSEKYGIYSFEAIAQGVDWTNQDLDVEEDSVHKVLKEMLATLSFGGGMGVTQ